MHTRILYITYITNNGLHKYIQKKQKYIPLKLNTWTEVGYKTEASMDSDLAVGLLLLVITSLWAPLLELFLQLRSATMRIRGLTIATASLTHESTCSSLWALYVTKRSMKLYKIFNTEK